MKTNLDNLFKANKNLENDGVDFVVREADEKTQTKELSFRVRRFSPTNTRAKAAMAAYYKPHARQIELGTLPQEKSFEININLFIDMCLVSWKGVEMEDKEVECTKENAQKLFKALPDLFNALWDHCNDFQSYKEDVGNS